MAEAVLFLIRNQYTTGAVKGWGQKGGGCINPTLAHHAGEIAPQGSPSGSNT